jgi:hypothetical protein
MNLSPLCPGSLQQPQQLRHDCQGKSSEEPAENTLSWRVVRGKGDNQARDRRDGISGDGKLHHQLSPP